MKTNIAFLTALLIFAATPAVAVRAEETADTPIAAVEEIYGDDSAPAGEGASGGVYSDETEDDTAEEIFSEAELIPSETVCSGDTAADNSTDLIGESAEFTADALPAKPTVTVKTAFGGKTITFSCTDADAEIYYNFGSSAITTESKHVKAGETVFIDEPMATGVYFKSYRDGRWCREVGKWGFNNVRIAKPLITQSGPASENKFKMYTQTKDSYMIYTLDGSEPAVEEGTQQLKVKNGRIIWGTSTVLEVPAGRTIKAIAVRCGLVTSEVMEFTNTSSGSQTVPALPDIKDAGLDRPLTNPPKVLINRNVRQAGGKYCSNAKAAEDRFDMYANLCRQRGFTVTKSTPGTDSSGTTMIFYGVYYENKLAAYFVGTYGIDPNYRSGNEYKTIIYVLDGEEIKS